MLEILAYRTVAVVILQTRTDSLNRLLYQVCDGLQKLILPTETQKSHFCVRPWSLLTISNFFERGPTDATVF